MSIKNFSMVPCPKCGEDTLHIAMACRTCGTVSEFNFEARQRARKRRMARINRLGFNPNWQEQRDAARAKRKYNAALPSAQFAGPKFATSVFGSGRERTRTK